MKKIINLLTIAVVFTMVLSCSQDSEQVLNHNSNKLTKRTGGWYFAFTVYRDCTGDFWCDTPPKDCLVKCTTCSALSQEVIDAIADLDYAISEGKEATAEWFEGEDVDVLFPNLESENLELLQSGDYELVKWTNSCINTHITYLAGESNVSDTNYEIAIVLGIE